MDGSRAVMLSGLPVITYTTKKACAQRVSAGAVAGDFTAAGQPLPLLAYNTSTEIRHFSPPPHLHLCPLLPNPRPLCGRPLHMVTLQHSVSVIRRQYLVQSVLFCSLAVLDPGL